MVEELQEAGGTQRGHYRATVEYDGTEYHGFQVQAGTATIQGAIEDALSRTVGEAVRIAGAGRTDAGVHAVGQVIGFRLMWRHSVDDLQRALNARLPADIAIRDLKHAAEGFHPRFSASSRVYRYTVLNQPQRSPLASRFSHQVAGDLSLEDMNRGAAVLVGRHDFGTFGNPTQGDSTEREVVSATWEQRDHWLTFDIEANGFLRRMVRTVVAALLLVGRGQVDSSAIADLLEARDRAQAPPPAPACGLCLMQVKY
jgi:tRNA pseudouridine38-40 synthase